MLFKVKVEIGPKLEVGYIVNLKKIKLNLQLHITQTSLQAL